MRTLACLFALALLLGAESAVAQTADDAPGTGDDATAASDASADDTAKSVSADDDAKSKSADDTKKAEKDTAKESKAPAYGHGRQFHLRAGIVGGYNMIFRYDRSPFCVKPDPAKSTKDQQKFCGHQAPFGVDLALGFAPANAIELFLWGRLGFTREAATDTNPLAIIGAGLRFYSMSDSAFKVFIEPALGFELEGGGTKENWQNTYANYRPQYKKDMIFHIAGGPQYDFAKNVGMYLDAGLTVGIFRSIHSEMELALGVQARFP